MKNEETKVHNMHKSSKKHISKGGNNTLLVDVVGRKVFKVADVKQLIKEVTTDKISFSKMVEKMNDRVDEWYSGQPLRPLVKMDIIRYLDAYLKEFKLTDEMEQSILQTLTLLRKNVVVDAKDILFRLNVLDNKN